MSCTVIKQENDPYFGINAAKVELIKRTCCKDFTEDQIKEVLYMSAHSGLDPLMRQIYPIKRKSYGKDIVTFQTGIDGFRAIAERTGRYAPGKKAEFVYKDGKLYAATVFVKKMTADGTWHECSDTALYEEYYVDTNPLWKTKPHVMCAKCAESLALRRAFPNDFKNMYTKEEMMAGKVDELLENDEDEICVDALPEDEVEMIVPSGVNIDKNQLEECIQMLAKNKGNPIPVQKKILNDRSDKFWEWYNSDSRVKFMQKQRVA